MTKTRLLLVHPDFLPTALEAARIAGVPADNIALFNAPSNSVATTSHRNLDDLIVNGLSQGPQFVERRLSAGESKRKVAFLSFSSGTTGKPKVGF